MIRRALLVLLFACACLSASAGAHADPAKSASWRHASLSLGETQSVLYSRPLAAPSKEHAEGTLFLVVSSATDDGGARIDGVEWDIASSRPLRRVLLSDRSSEIFEIAVERAGDEIVVVTSGRESPAHVLVVGPDLRVRADTELDHGVFPSVAVDDRFIVVGLYEDRTPISPKTHLEEGVSVQNALAFHVRVIDRATHAIVGARVFLGDELFIAHYYYFPTISHAIALRDGHAFIGLSGGHDGVFYDAKLPSLGAVRSRKIDKLAAPMGLMLFDVGSSTLVLSSKEWFTLSPDLVPSAIHPNKVERFAYANGEALVDGPFTGAPPFRTTNVGDCTDLAFAWGRALARCDDEIRWRK